MEKKEKKKSYVSPKVETVEIRMHEVLCMSTSVNTNDPTTGEQEIVF